MSDHTNEYQLSTVLFTDIQGFSRMMENNEMATLDALKECNRIIFESVGRFRGKVLKTIGDGVLALFPNNLNAVKSAMEIQKDLYKYNANQPVERKVFLRAGVHMGDVYLMENDAVGEVINIASRLQSIARPGGICVSREVYNQVFNKISFQVADIGKVNLKNITKEIYAYEILTEFHSHIRSTAEQYVRQEIGADNRAQSNVKEESVLTKIFTDLRRVDKQELQNLLNWPLQKLETALTRLEQSHVISQFKQQDGKVSFGVEKYEDLQSELKDQLNFKFQFEPPFPTHGPDEKRKKLRGMKAKLKERGFPWVKQKIMDAKEGAVAGFRSHFIVFLAVNAFLFFLNMGTSAGFPWFYFPLGGWGIGIMSHLMSVLNKRKEAEQVSQIETMSDEQYLLLRKYQQSLFGFRHHLMSFASVIAYLFGINMITSPGFLWSLIPAGGWGIGLVAHWSAASSAKSQLKKKLKEAGVDLKNLKSTFFSQMGTPASQAGSDHVQKAQAIKSSILAEMKDNKDIRHQWGEMEPLLDKFVQQIEDLTKSRDEMDRILGTVSLTEIKDELSSLRRKNETANSPALKKEYDRSISQHENHKKAIEDMMNQREIIDVRLHSSLTLLNQLKLDAARIKNLSKLEEPYSLKELREKTAELSQYIDDVHSEIGKLEL